MSRSGPERVLDALPVGLAVWIAGGVLLTFAARLTYPGDLEWMEGGMLSHAWRLQQGWPIYIDPSAEFIPFIYPPGYSALLAAAGSVFGLDYPVGRAISILGSVAACAAILWVCVRQGRSWVAGVVGAACYLGCFRASGSFHDLVRPDGLAIGLMAWSLVLAVERRRGAEIASGLLLCAAFLVKHNLAIFGLPVVLALWLGRGRGVAARFVAASAGPALVMTVLLQLRSGGRFLAYVLEVPGAHPMLWDRLTAGAPGELAQWQLVAAATGVLALLLAVPRRIPLPATVGLAGVLAVGGALAGALQPTIKGIPMAPPPAVGAILAIFGAGIGAALAYGVGSVVQRERPEWRWWMAFGVGLTAVVVVGLMRAHFGGFMNVLMPGHWVLAAGMALGVASIRHRWPGLPATGATMLLMVGQLGWMVRELELDGVVPGESEVAAGDALVEVLREHCDGPVLSPHFAWLPTRLGQPPSLHLIALWDINHEDGPFRDHIGVVGAAARAGHWACVLEGGRQPIGYGVEPNYDLHGMVPGPARGFVPQTGWRVRPWQLYVRPEAE